MNSEGEPQRRGKNKSTFNTDRDGRVGRLAQERMMVVTRRSEARRRGETDDLADQQIARLDRLIQKIKSDFGG
jgi:hypothetical protein